MRVAFIGVGHWHAAEFYLPALLARDVHIVAISDEEQEAVEAALREHPQRRLLMLLTLRGHPLWAGLREALRGLVVYWHVVAAFLALATLAVLVVRSGNEAGGAILPGELELRALLDRLLVVRPRTKEVFLGHPVMLLALLLALRRVRVGVWIAFAVGAIGQVSLLNSFCHVHTPLLLTLIRVFNGLWLGALGGVVLCLLWDALGGAPPAQEQPAPPEDEGDDEP